MIFLKTAVNAGKAKNYKREELPLKIFVREESSGSRLKRCIKKGIGTIRQEIKE
jgi:hypothetical protein